jgi:hypothetical protein
MMRRVAVLLLVALPLLPVRADALTLNEIVELHKAGLGDEVLVALIEANKIIYSLEAGAIRDLKSDGLSDRVLIAIINSGRQHLPPPAPSAEPEPAAASAPAPQVLVIEHHAPAPAPQIIIQQVPVYVPVPVTGRPPRSVRADRLVTPASPYYVGQVREPEPRKAPEPVYWGFGGKLRPDAWQDRNEAVRSQKSEGRREKD